MILPENHHCIPGNGSASQDAHCHLAGTATESCRCFTVASSQTVQNMVGTASAHCCSSFAIKRCSGSEAMWCEILLGKAPCKALVVPAKAPYRLEANPYAWCVLSSECYLFVSAGVACNELPPGSWLSIWGLTVNLCHWVTPSSVAVDRSVSGTEKTILSPHVASNTATVDTYPTSHWYQQRLLEKEWLPSCTHLLHLLLPLSRSLTRFLCVNVTQSRVSRERNLNWGFAQIKLSCGE